MISVAMAVYEGEKYLREQMDSILAQLEAADEVVVSLDPSADESEKILQSYCEADSRVRLCAGPGSGVMANFENALQKCRGDIIFLADQDDRWEPDKVRQCREALAKDGVLLVLHDAAVYDEHLQKVLYPSFFAYKGCKKGFWQNILKNSYMGCCMAFRRELLSSALPFPKKIPMHDQWIGLLAERFGETVFVERQLLAYRRHQENRTALSHAGLFQMIRWRFWIMRAVFLAKKRK